MSNVTRRDFLASVGIGSACLALPSLPLALPAPLKLYSVCEAGYDSYWLEGWCDAVWASSEEKALQWARDNFGGECWPEETPEVRVLSVWDGTKPDVHDGMNERRTRILREAGWQEEGDNECTCCGRHDWGMSCWAVCGSCWCCPECRLDDCPDCEAI